MANNNVTTWEPFEDEYPELKLPRYEPFGEKYPWTELDIYQPYGEAYPEVNLERYKAFQQAYPELGMFPEAGEAIQRLLSGEGLRLPIEELMGAYTAEEKRALEEYMPQIRESWAGRGLLRSGMAREAEEEAVTKAATARGTYRAELEKESAIRVQEGLIQGLGLAMQLTGMEYQAQVGAWSAAQGEYEKEYQSALQAGIAESEARERGWAAANQEYVRQFTSGIDATKFAQGIRERAYEAGRNEYQKVYDSAIAAGISEYQAQAQAWQAAQAEYARIQQMEYGEYMWQLEAELRRELAEMGYDAQQTSSIWGSIGTIIGTIIGGAVGGPAGAAVGGTVGGATAGGLS